MALEILTERDFVGAGVGDNGGCVTAQGDHD
jgi:hypothetical protein